MKENIRNKIKIIWYIGAVFTALGLLVTAFADSFAIGLACLLSIIAWSVRERCMICFLNKKYKKP